MLPPHHDVLGPKYERRQRPRNSQGFRIGESRAFPSNMQRPEKPAPHGAPHRDIRSPWRQLLSLPIPCHGHWPRSCCQSRVRPPAICGKPCFRGRSRIHATVCVLGPCLLAGCDHAACVDGGSRGKDMGAGGRCGVAGGRRPLEGSYSRLGARAGTVCGWACRGLGDAVRSGGTGLSVRGRLGSCGVQWLFQSCCSGRQVGHWAAIAWREDGFQKCS